MTKNVMVAIYWAILGALLFLFAVVVSNLASGQEPKLPEPWMPAFKAWMEEQKKAKAHEPMPWELPCVCACTEGPNQDKCCAEGPVAQSGEHLPCKQGAVGAEPARSTKP